MTQNKATAFDDAGMFEFLEASYLQDAGNGRVGQVFTLFKLNARAIFNLAAADVSTEHRHGRAFRDSLEKYGAVLHNGVDARGRVVAAYRYYEAENAAAMEAGKTTLMTAGYFQEGRLMNPAESIPAAQQFDTDGSLKAITYSAFEGESDTINVIKGEFCKGFPAPLAREARYVWVYPDKEFQDRVVELPFWAKARRSGMNPV